MRAKEWSLFLLPKNIIFAHLSQSPLIIPFILLFCSYWIEMMMVYDCSYNNHAFHNKMLSSLNSNKMYCFVWWMTWAPKFLPTMQFHPHPFLSISVFKYLDNTLSCLCSFKLSFKPWLISSFTRSMSYAVISLAFTLASIFC